MTVAAARLHHLALAVRLEADVGRQRQRMLLRLLL